MSEDPDVLEGCDVCGEGHETTECPVLGLVPDTIPLTATRARLSLPHFLTVGEGENVCVVARLPISSKTKLGPFEAPRVLSIDATETDFLLKVHLKEMSSFILDTSSELECNWLSLVQTAVIEEQQNCMALQIGVDIFYITMRDIAAGEELKVWYAPHYAKKIGKSPKPDGITKTMLRSPMLLEDLPGADDGPVMDDSTGLPLETQEQLPEKALILCEYCMVPFPSAASLDAHICPRLKQQQQQQQDEDGADQHQGQEEELAEMETIHIEGTPQSVDVFSLLTEPCASRVKVAPSSGGDNDEIKCSRCPRKFHTIQELAQHMKAHIMRDIGGARKRGRKRKEKMIHVNNDHQQSKRASTPKKKRIEKTEEPEEEDFDDDVVESDHDTSFEEVEITGSGEGRRRSSRIRSGRVKITSALNLLNIKEEPESDDGQKEEEGVEEENDDVNKEADKSEETTEEDHDKKVAEKNDQISADFIVKVSRRIKGEGEETGEMYEDVDISSERITTSEDGNRTVDVVMYGSQVVEVNIKDAEEGITGKILESMKDLPEDVAELLGTFSKEEDKIEKDDLEATVDENVENEPEMKNDSAEQKENEKEKKSETVVTKKKKVEKKREIKKEKDNEKSVSSAFKEEIVEKYIKENKAVVDEVKGKLYCVQCEKNFKGWKCFENHLLKHEGVFYCEVCKRNFCSEKKRTSHRCFAVKTESLYTEIEGVFVCSMCNEKFIQEEAIKEHMRGHSEEYPCEKCGKLFARQESIATHKCEANQLTFSKMFTCDFCGKQYENEKYLIRHMASHAGDFTCEKCSKAFARKENLLQHLLLCDPEQLVRRKIPCFPCKECKKVFTKELSLTKHMTKHTGEFRCNTCGKDFTNHMTMRRHNCVAVDIDELNLQCKECGKHFAKRKQLIEHMVVHSGKFVCYICNEAFIRKSDLMKHTLMCSAKIQKETTGLINCSMCDSMFGNPKEFQDHYIQHTHPYHCTKCAKRYKLKIHLDSHRCLDTEGDYICGQCNRSFTAEKYLNKHLDFHKLKPYACTKCNRNFARASFAYNHVCVDDAGKRCRFQKIFDKDIRTLIKKKPVQRVVCPVCGHSFHNPSNLNKHMITHGEKKEQCDVCHKMFHLKVALKAHKDEVHTTTYKYQCKVCNKLMKSRNSLYGHMNQFHADKGLIYKCDDCGKVFRQKGNMKKHLMTHKAHKLYSCELCARTFKYPDQLRRHVRWHQSGEQYECRQCKEKFQLQFELQRHINQVHAGVIYNCEYCDVTTHHAHTLRRHLQKRHTNHPAWQVNTFEYIKNRRQVRAKKEQDIIHVSFTSENQSENADGAGTEGAQGPVLLAQIEGPGGADGPGSQTVIIQAPPGSKLDSNNLTPEIYEVLKNLSARVGNRDGSNIMVSQIKANDTLAKIKEGSVKVTEAGLVLEEEDEATMKQEVMDESLLEMQDNDEEETNLEELNIATPRPGSNKVIVSDGDRQIEVDITPAIQDPATTHLTLSAFEDPATSVQYLMPQGEKDSLPDAAVGYPIAFTSASSMPQQLTFLGELPQYVTAGNTAAEYGTAAGNSVQFVSSVDNGSGQVQYQIEQQQPQQQQQQQQEVFVHIDQGIVGNNGISMEEVQQLVQQQILQQLQSQQFNVGADQVQGQVQLSADQLQGQVQVNSDQVQLSAEQVQGQEQLDQGYAQMQVSADQVQFAAEQVQGQLSQEQVQLSSDQVQQISSDMVPSQVQMLADQILGQVSQ